jgi:UDP-3-O-[3-hydroxymyristoyl] glucosamine N-acyltransferase
MKLHPPVTVKELAAEFHARVIGDENQLISGLNEINNTKSGDLTFVDHEKYYQKALASNASVIIINKEVTPPSGKTLIVSDNPFVIYNELAKRYQPFCFSQKAIADSAAIGAGTQIFPNVFIGENVRIGSNCIIYPGVVIYAYCAIGDNVIIHGNTTIGSDAFYYKKDSSGYNKMHTAGRAVIESNVEIGSNCTIDAGVSDETRIGEGTKIDSQVHIGHDVKVGKQCIFAAHVGIAGNTVIGNGVTLWGKVGVNKNITIGDNAVVMATSAVPKSLEGGKTYLGIPVNEVRAAAKELILIKKLPEMWEKIKNL